MEPQNLTARAALLIIDVQQGFDDPVWGRRNNPDAEQNIARLLETWRRARGPVFHIQHLSRDPASPLRPGQPGADIRDEVAPASGEPVITKEVNSAFIGTDLERRLRDDGISDLVIVGLTTNHCVSTTVRMAANLGFRTWVVSDATAAFDRTGHDGRYFNGEDVHALSLASLHGEFATVIGSEAIIGVAPPEAARAPART